MSDGMEDRIAKSFGHLEPEDGLRERVLGSLPEDRASPRPLWTKVLVPAVALCLALAVAKLTLPLVDESPPPAYVSSRLFTDGNVQAVLRVMTKRLEALGATKTEVEAGEARGEIFVAVAPEDPRAVRETLLRPGTLEFRIVIEGDYVHDEPGGRMVQRADGSLSMLVREGEGFTGADIDPDEVRVQPPADPSGRSGWVVAFGIVDEQREAFATFTRENINRYLAIIIDGRVEAAPRIASELPGTGIISGGGPGGFTREEAESLAAVLISGAYPAEVRPR